MDIKTILSQSPKEYLAENSDAYKKLEAKAGITNKEQMAWVIVKRATESAERERVALTSKRQISFKAGMLIGETVDENWRERVVHEAYWTLVDAGNLTNEAKPVFTLPPTTFSQFEKEWGSLPVEIADAIHRIIRKYNPNWDWENLSGEV